MFQGGSGRTYSRGLCTISISFLYNVPWPQGFSGAKARQDGGFGTDWKKLEQMETRKRDHVA